MQAKKMDINEIKSLLPHRYPFLLVDRVTYLEEPKIIAVKNVTVNEPFFQGHFPGNPVMPGVLIVEALAQTCGIVMLNRPENRGKSAYFASINNVKFRRPVLPGDALILEVEVTKWKAKLAQAHGVAKVAEEVACEADFLLIMIPEDKVKIGKNTD